MFACLRLWFRIGVYTTRCDFGVLILTRFDAMFWFV